LVSCHFSRWGPSPPPRAGSPAFHEASGQRCFCGGPSLMLLPSRPNPRSRPKTPIEVRAIGFPPHDAPDHISSGGMAQILHYACCGVQGGTPVCRVLRLARPFLCSIPRLVQNFRYHPPGPRFGWEFSLVPPSPFLHPRRAWLIFACSLNSRRGLSTPTRFFRVSRDVLALLVKPGLDTHTSCVVDVAFSLHSGLRLTPRGFLCITGTLAWYGH